MRLGDYVGGSALLDLLRGKFSDCRQHVKAGFTSIIVMDLYQAFVD